MLFVISFCFDNDVNNDNLTKLTARNLYKNTTTYQKTRPSTNLQFLHIIDFFKILRMLIVIVAHKVKEGYIDKLKVTNFFHEIDFLEVVFDHELRIEKNIASTNPITQYFFPILNSWSKRS